MDIKVICKKLQLKGSLQNYIILSGGNINTTYKVICRDGNKTNEYLLQRINKNVFKEPDKVMKNIIEVTDYMRSHNTTGLQILEFNKCADGSSYVTDELGDFWRACQFIDSVCYDTTDDLQVIEEAGLAFGEFQVMLDGYDVNKLYVSIPDFHNTKLRIENLINAVIYSADDRRSVSTEEAEYIISNKDKAEILSDLLEEDKLPLRVTHNDTKFNNVIFSASTKKALAVIDLDTIMPGLCAYDFGDGARAICSTAKEDEEDISKVMFDLDKFEHFTRGYLKHLSSRITKLEAETLADSVYVMTIELASRFLLDYLSGDTYFRVFKENHNLIRAKCQIALCKDIEAKMPKIREIVKKYTQQ